MLNSFFDKYIFTSTLKYTHNNFFLVDIPFMMVPVEMLIAVAGSSDVELHKKVYATVKQGTKEKFMPRLSGFSTERNKELDFLKTFFMASGWGQIEVIDFNADSKRALVVLESSPFASALRGKATLPVDIFFKGMLAGAFSVLFKEDIDCVETECVALNNERCKFVLKPQTEFDFSNKMVQDQLHVE